MVKPGRSSIARLSATASCHTWGGVDACAKGWMSEGFRAHCHLSLIGHMELHWVDGVGRHIQTPQLDHRVSEVGQK